MSPSPHPLSIDAAGAEHPTRPALISAEKVFSFQELAQRTRWLRGALGRDRPLLRAGDCLPIIGRPSIDSVCSVYAALEEGLCLVPLHARWTRGEREDFLARLGLATPWTPSLEPSAPAGRRALRDWESSMSLAILPTSGSTGRPKGVRLSRGAFLASAAASARRLGTAENDVGLLSLPTAHVGGLSILIRHLIARRPVVLPDGSGAFRAAEILETVRRHRVTSLSLVPTMLRRVLATGESVPPSLRCVLIGGAAAPSTLMDEARRRGWPVRATYGLTEACSQVATQLGGPPSSA